MGELPAFRRLSARRTTSYPSDERTAGEKPAVRPKHTNLKTALALGMTEAEILADYEDLEAEDLRACQAYAADMLQVRSIYRLAS